MATVAYIGPVLAHGTSLGPFDLLSQYGLSHQPGVAVHNFAGADEIQALIPWQSLDWSEVHAGHLPLWNPYSVLGMPLAFNLQSAPFSLSVAIGYLFPLHLAHSATVLARLLIAGSGTYVLSRVLRLGVLAAAFAGSSYELCGGFSIWLGSNVSDIMAFCGWIFVGVLLVQRPGHRPRHICLLAVVLALALYGGEPQSAALLIAAVVLFVLVGQYPTFSARHWREGLHALVRVALAVLGALGLVSPLYFPALQLGPGSVRAIYPQVSGLPLYDLTHLLFASYNGSPVVGAQVIGPNNLYVSMLYIGVIASALGIVGLATTWRQGEVAGFFAIAMCSGLLLFFEPLVPLLRALPYAKVFRLFVAMTPLDFALVMLGAFGCDRLARSWRERRVLHSYFVALSFVAVVLFGLGLKLVFFSGGLSPEASRTRADSFIWPSAQLALCALVALVFVLARRARRGEGFARLVVGVLVLAQTAFLVEVGSGIWSSSSSFFAVTPPIAALQHVVGDSLVALEDCPYPNSFSATGILPNANVAYGLDELTVYDPILPVAYYSSYGSAIGQSVTVSSPGVFCPSINSLSLARRYGVVYVLGPSNAPAPPGMLFVRTLGQEVLYKVPDSGLAMLSPLARSKNSGEASVSILAVKRPDPAAWQIEVNARAASLLQLHLTAVPGWRASIDGRSLSLQVYDGVMFQAKVPAGRHVIRLRYWPVAFDWGLLCAAITALLLAILGLFDGKAFGFKHHRSSRSVAK